MSRSPADYRFGHFRVDAAQRVLFRQDHPVPLPPKVFDVLLALLESHGRVVQKQDLLDRVWPGTFVEEANLSVNVSALRKVIGDDAIDTVPKRGYRFVAPLLPEAPAVTTSAPHLSRARWVLAGAGLTIAVATALYMKPARAYEIAVLPFETTGVNPVAGYVAESITEGVTDRLSAIGTRLLRVKAQSLVAGRVSPGANAVAAGRQLGVDAVVTGRIVERSGQWTLRAECVSVADGTLLWGDDFPEQSLGAGDQSQRDIASEVAAHLPIRLSAEERERVSRPMTRNAEAEKLMGRARLLFYQATPESLQRALDYSQQAMALDPQYVVPYGEIASVYSLLSFSDVMDPREAHVKVLEWTARAMKIDGAASVSRIAALGEQATYEWDWPGVRKAGFLHPFYREYLMAAGRADDLLAVDRRQAHPDPRHALNEHWFATSLYYARHFDEAIQHFRQAIEIDPAFQWAHLNLGWTYVQRKQYDDAIREMQLASSLKRTVGSLGHAYAVSGRRQRARQILDDLLARSAREYVTPLAVAKIYVGLGENDHALEWMQKACDRHVPEMTRVRMDPIYDPLRGDPRFKGILDCVGAGS